MRCIVIAIVLLTTVSHAQDYTKDCPDTYAFNWANLEWYDTIHVEWGSTGSGPDECLESDPGYYFGYDPSTNITTGAAGSTQAGCECAYQQAPGSVMLVAQLRDVPAHVITKGAFDKNGNAPPADLDILFDKLVVKVVDANNKSRYFLCLAASRSLKNRKPPSIAWHKIRFATEIKRPNYTIVDGTLEALSGGNYQVVVEMEMTIGVPGGNTKQVAKTIKFRVR